MLNHIVIMGRLVANPDTRTTPNGVSVTTFRLACDRDRKNKDTGERETDFISVVAWRNTADFVAKYFSKGRMVVAEGRLQIRPYTDKEGNKRTAAEVVAENVYFGDSKKDGDGPRNDYDGSGSSPADTGNKFSELEDDDGDLPF